jgi:hypothetical protein
MASETDIDLADLAVAGWSDDEARPRKGLLATEVPLRATLQVRDPEALAERLALAPADAAVAIQRFVFIANMLYAHARAPGTWVFYSRDRTFYARMRQLRRYMPPGFTLENVLAAVESLEQAGLIEHRRTAPSFSARYRSRLRASPLLLSLAEGQRLQVVSEAREFVILRDAGGRLVAYPETARTLAMRRDVLEHNAMLRSLEVRVVHPDATHDPDGLLRVRGQWLDPARCVYCRIFNGRWTRGGRWYGPFWQALPKDVRAALRLNGEPVIERDFPACHARLLCARLGVALPFGDPGFDPYTIAALPRRDVKRAFNILLNAGDERRAIAALARELAEQGTAAPFSHARRLAEAVRSRFPGLERVWCTGIGLRLQCVDAEICARVQRRLRRGGVPVLSIHDSFVVATPSAALLNEVMHDELERACRGESLRAIRRAPI